MPSKVAISLEQPSLSCVRADSIAPSHSPASTKRCILRVIEKATSQSIALMAEASLDGGGIMWRRNRICPDTTKRRFLWINGYFRWHFIMQALSRYRWEVYHLKSSRGFLINVRCSIFYMVHFFATSMVQAKYSDYILVSEHSPTIQVFKRMMFFQSGTLHMILMITYIFMMSPHVAPLWVGADIIGLGCQSRGYY